MSGKDWNKVGRFISKFFRDWNQNIGQEEQPGGIKKKFSVIVNDKEQIIGGRTENEAIFQPIKHLSG